MRKSGMEIIKKVSLGRRYTGCFITDGIIGLNIALYRNDSWFLEL